MEALPSEAMHIVITRRDTPLDMPDGITSSMISLSDGLIRLGHHVTMVGTSFGNVQTVRDAAYARRYPALRALGHISYGGQLESLIFWYERGRSVVRRLSPDLLLLNGVLPFRLSRVPTIAVFHDRELRGSWGAFVQNAYRRHSYSQTDVALATSTEILSAGRWVIPKLSGPLANSVVMEGRRNRPIADRRPVILHMGTAEYKNPGASLRGFTAARLDEAYELVITGRPTEALRSAGLSQSKSRAGLLWSDTCPPTPS